MAAPTRPPPLLLTFDSHEACDRISARLLQLRLGGASNVAYLGRRDTSLIIAADGGPAERRGQVHEELTYAQEVVLFAAAMDAHVPDVVATHDSLRPLEREAWKEKLNARFRAPVCQKGHPPAFPFRLRSLAHVVVSADAAMLRVASPVIIPPLSRTCPLLRPKPVYASLGYGDDAIAAPTRCLSKLSRPSFDAERDHWKSDATRDVTSDATTSGDAASAAEGGELFAMQ